MVKRDFGAVLREAFPPEMEICDLSDKEFAGRLGVAKIAIEEPRAVAATVTGRRIVVCRDYGNHGI